MISVKELAGWCRRVAISLNAGLDIVTVLEREAGNHALGSTYVPSGTSGAGPSAPPIQAPPVQGVGSDFDETNPHDYRERMRRREAAWREQMEKRPRKPPIFLYSNMRKICGYAAGRVREGATLYEAFSEVGGHFPKMFVPMISVAERSGSLGETFAELARYYEHQLKLKREFWRTMIYPIFQMGAVLFIITIFIIIIGALGKTVSLFGITFFGLGGALKFNLLFLFCTACVSTVYYVFKHHVSAGNNYLQLALNRIPVIGAAMQCFAMARFTWALHFTTKTGMDIQEAVILAFDVAAYAPINQHMDKVLEKINRGSSLHDAFASTHGFSHDFLVFMRTGEESGELPETLMKLSNEYTEQSKVHMKVIGVIFHFVTFFLVAGIIILFIFQIIGQAYLDPLNETLKNPMGFIWPGLQYQSR